MAFFSSQAGGRDIAWLILLSAIWGSSFLFIKIGIGSIPPASLTALRLIIAALALVAYCLAMGQRLSGIYGGGFGQWRRFLVISVLGNALPFTLISWGEQNIDSGLAAVLIGTMPIFTLLLAHYFTHDERLSPLRLLGVCIGFSGLVILMGPDVFEEVDARVDAELVGQGAVVLAAISYAGATVYGRRLYRHSPLMITAASTIGAATIMIPVALIMDGALFFGDAPLSLSPASIAAGIVLGLVNTAAGGIIFFHLLRRTGATFTSQCNYLIPVCGLIWGMVVLGEALPLETIAALAVILGGVALIRRDMPAFDRENRPPETEKPKG